MTTFQDQPPQSRRAVRQSERDGATGSQAASGDVPVTPPQPSFVQQPSATPSQSHAAPPVSGRRSRAVAPSGLVDMPTSPPYPGSEPLTYTTQGAPGAQQPSGSATPPQQTGEQPSFRVRDFSPEASRRSPSFVTPPAADAAPLDYRTQAGPAVSAAPASQDASAAPASPAPNPPVALSVTGTPITASGTPLTESAFVAAPPAVDPLTSTGTSLTATGTPLTATGTPEVAMTRRELRAQQAERDAAAARASGTFGVPPLVEPSAPTATLSSAMAEFEALTRAAQGVAAPLPVPEQSSQGDASDADDLDDSTSTDAAAEAATPDADTAVDGVEADDDAAESARVEAEREQAEAAQAEADEQQRARDAAASALAAAQAEAANRAREDAKLQAELTAQRAFEAEQANRARQAEAAQLAHAAQLAEAQEAQAREDQAAASAAPIEDELASAPVTPADPLAAILGSGYVPVSTPAEPALPAPDLVAPAPAAPAVDPLNPAFVAPDLHQTGSHATSTGHWTRQAELDDETQPHENLLSRDVGGGNVATTTSALVLPVIPAPADFGTIINGTGEILVTGSIELPRSLGATGGDQRRYDDPDVDNLFDAFDNEIISTDSAPVRAIRAVSTHTSTHGVIANNKPKNGNRMLIILLASTVTLAVAVVALLAVAANLFP